MRDLISRMSYVVIILFMCITTEVKSFGIFSSSSPNTISMVNNKEKVLFINSLDSPSSSSSISINNNNKIELLNDITEERTNLLSNLIKTNPILLPGSTESFATIAPGVWKVIYAPHIKTFNNILTKLSGNKVLRGFDPIIYDMKLDNDKEGIIVSHAKYNNIPFGIGSGYLSVSGTYSSQDELNICRVDFNRAWYKPITSNEEQPYPNIESVPSSISKDVINKLGQTFFIDAVSTFPVSYLDNNMIVFDFELLGTRICASKDVKLTTAK